MEPGHGPVPVAICLFTFFVSEVFFGEEGRGS